MSAGGGNELGCGLCSAHLLEPERLVPTQVASGYLWDFLLLHFRVQEIYSQWVLWFIRKVSEELKM